MKKYCPCGRFVALIKGGHIRRGTEFVCRECYSRLVNDKERADDLDAMVRGPAQDNTTLDFLKGIFHGGVGP